jgi:hypothetical protein
MNLASLTPNQKLLAAIVGGTTLFIALVLLLDGGGGGGSSLGGSVANASDDFDIDICSFLTTEDIAAATGIEGMTAHDEGTSSGTGSRVCQFDTGNGMLPTLTMWARPADDVPFPGEQATFMQYARESYQGEDIKGIGDGAFVAGGHVYVERGGVVVEISTMVMNGYLPGKIEGEPLVELAKAAAARMPATAES